MWLSMACIVAGDSRYWRGARCCLCDRVMRCLGTTILKPTGSRRASSLYTERWRLVHFPCAHFQSPSPSCASHLKCVHISLLVGRMEKEVSRAATRATVGSASTTAPVFDKLKCHLVVAPNMLAVVFISAQKITKRTGSLDFHVLALR